MLDLPTPTVARTHESIAQTASAALQRNGFHFVSGRDLAAAIAELGASGWTEYADSWNDLETDRFMADGGTYRRRRFGCFDLRGGVLRPKPPQPHFQTRDHNPLNGGVARVFAPVPDPIAFHAANVALVHLCAAAWSGLSAPAAWHIEMHQFRIEAQADARGLPTPEGVHRDGVDFVLTLLVRRDNIGGGATSIVSPEGEILGTMTLADPMDACFIDDRRVRHGVSPIVPLDATKPATRDVLVLTFRSEAG